METNERWTSIPFRRYIFFVLLGFCQNMLYFLWPICFADLLEILQARVVPKNHITRKIDAHLLWKLEDLAKYEVKYAYPLPFSWLNMSTHWISITLLDTLISHWCRWGSENGKRIANIAWRLQFRKTKSVWQVKKLFRLYQLISIKIYTFL